MTPRGAAPLIAMRQSGQRPAGSVWISFGNFLEPDWWRWSNTCDRPELLIRPGDPIERLDLRCLLGLDLILFFSDWCASVSRLHDRLTEYAKEIAVMSPAFEADIGWRWINGVGRVPFEQAQPARRVA